MWQNFAKSVHADGTIRIKLFQDLDLPLSTLPRSMTLLKIRLKNTDLWILKQLLWQLCHVPQLHIFISFYWKGLRDGIPDVNQKICDRLLSFSKVYFCKRQFASYITSFIKRS